MSILWNYTLMNKDVILDYKKLSWRKDLPNWLNLPKDIWSIILKNPEYWIIMRNTCKYFKDLITPKFCMLILYQMDLTFLDYCWFEDCHYTCILCYEIFTILKNVIRKFIFKKISNGFIRHRVLLCLVQKNRIEIGFVLKF